MALKREMSKAYDRVGWSFLEAMMKRVGFSNRWVNLVVHCVLTASFSFLTNGHPVGKVFSSRGLRQGYPFSLYLFLLCVEGFLALLRKAQNDRKLMGVVCARGAPHINHLLFTNGSIIFCNADEARCLAVKGVLEAYENVSGQLINFQKSAISYIPNLAEDRQGALSTSLGLSNDLSHESYLGLPFFIGRNKRRLFDNIKERVWKSYKCGGANCFHLEVERSL